MNVDLQMVYSEPQARIFFESQARRRIVTKGRRLGFTQGGSQAMIEYMLDRPIGCLWGDTVNGNIDRYVERYWMPKLSRLPRSMWQWSKQSKKMYIGNSFCDFRSADNPYNWEGFGYHIVYLNEAGIILRNPYLYENAVRPMLLDFPDSILIAGGTPKGKTPPVFYDLWQHGMRGREDWESFQFSSYMNPWIKRSEVDELVDEMSEEVVAQEIYGEFSDTTEWQFIEGGIIEAAIKQEHHSSAFANEAKVLGVDLAGSGSNATVFYKRQGLQTIEIIRRVGLKGDEMIGIAARILNDWDPDGAFFDGGYNPAVIDVLQNKLNFDVVTKVDFAGASTSPNYLNKRAQMWGDMRDWLASGGAIPDDRTLRRELQQQTYKFSNASKDGSIVQLTSKQDMKKEGLLSPDVADALALTFAIPVRKRTAADRYNSNRHSDSYDTEYNLFS